jgi:hypothetical protein
VLVALASASVRASPDFVQANYPDGTVAGYHPSPRRYRLPPLAASAPVTDYC